MKLFYIIENIWCLVILCAALPFHMIKAIQLGWQGKRIGRKWFGIIPVSMNMDYEEK